MSYPTSDVITWAKGSQALAGIGEYKKKVFTGGNVDSDLARKIYVERMSLEWQLSQNPTDSDNILVGQTNYVYDLCFPYILEAKYTSGGGGLVIDPVASGSTDIYPLVVNGSDFEVDGVTYNNPQIVGDDLMIFISGFNSEFQFAPTFFSYTATGIVITFGGFNANNYSSIIIQKFTT